MASPTRRSICCRQGGTHPRQDHSVRHRYRHRKGHRKIFKANTAILTAQPSSKMHANATAQAAKDLYGSCSEEWSIPKVGTPSEFLHLDALRNRNTVARTVSLTAPTAGSTLTGSTATVSATASDNIGVDSVDFYAGTTLIGSDNTAPYSDQLEHHDRRKREPSSITAKAKDGAVTSEPRRAYRSPSRTAAPRHQPENEAEPNGSFNQATSSRPREPR